MSSYEEIIDSLKRAYKMLIDATNNKRSVTDAEAFHCQVAIKDAITLLEPVMATVSMPNNICDCWHISQYTGKQECWGTKERDICDCNGNKNNCNFY